jgi:SAM-dependent methyltransferase
MTRRPRRRVGSVFRALRRSGPMGRPRGAYWDEVYRSDPDFFGGTASSLARSAVGPISRDSTGRRLVELGTGTGRDLCYFAQHGFDVAGCDLSDVAARTANERLAALRGEVPPTAHVRRVDAIEFLRELGPREVDVVYSNLYLNLETEEGRVVAIYREAARVLRPSGWFVLAVRSAADSWSARGTPLRPRVVDPGDGRPPLRFYEERELREYARPSFEVVTLREHPEGDPEFPIVVFSVSMRRRA